jgi:PAS domain S-box-containing protein
VSIHTGESEHGVQLREQAEAKFLAEEADPLSAKIASASPDSMRTFVHELRVHQIELEMQNEELRGSQVDLDTSRARYFDLYDLAPVGYCTVSEKGFFLQVNLKVATLLGAPRSVLVTQPMRRFILKSDLPHYYRLRKEVLQNMGQRSLELQMLKHDGTPFWAALAMTAAQEEDGAAVLRIVLIDITERKQAEGEREVLEGQLRESQKVQAMGTLAGGIAHDFNNMLAVILGNVELAMEGVNAHQAGIGPQVSDSLREISKAASRARSLVQQILSFSRRQPTECKPIALATVVHESLRLLRATLPARVELDVRCAPDVPVVLADASQMQQIVINLATNAMQAMNDGPGRIAIGLDCVVLDAALVDAHPALSAMKAQRSGRLVRLTMSDTGSGMAAATLARIFEPFFTTKPVGMGTGLGLAVVQGITHSHEGVIEVASELGKGTTFTLYLPAAPDHVALPAVNKTAVPATVAPAGRGLHIMYIDDEESLVLVTKLILEPRGYRVSSYVNQHEALAALRANPASFDLVVTDYNMPGMSGLDVARAVRLIRADLPVAVASGFIDETLRAQASAAGVRDLVLKADSMEGLCQAMERLAHATLPERPVSTVP